MIKITPEKELEFFKRAAYKLTPQINPVELAAIKKNGIFKMLQQAYVQGMIDVYEEYCEKIAVLEEENKKLKDEFCPADSSVIIDEEKITVKPLYPDGPPPSSIL